MVNILKQCSVLDNIVHQTIFLCAKMKIAAATFHHVIKFNWAVNIQIQSSYLFNKVRSLFFSLFSLLPQSDCTLDLKVGVVSIKAWAQI